MINKLKQQKGITLTSLAVVIVVILIITGALIYNAKDSVYINKLKKMYNDIDLLKEKVSVYYSEYGDIPASVRYYGLEELRDEGILNSVDEIYVIDLAAMQGISLNYGKDYQKIQNGNTPYIDSYKDLYIINKSNHMIYYVQGIEIEGVRYYTNQESGNVAINTKYYGDVRIPDGFYYVGGKKDEGIVISDVEGDDLENSKGGNQFVWIPIGNVKKDDGTTVAINLDRYTFETDGTPTPQGTAAIETYYQELATSTFGNTTAKNLQGFINSANNNGGYYIGRYEASNNGGKVESKANQATWTNITQPNAAIASRDMYTSSSYTSDLVNSYAWDTAIVFIQKFGQSNYSRQVSLNTSKLLTGEAGDEQLHINDMAGNVREWTTETSSKSGYPCMFRGGVCDSSITYTTSRSYHSTTSHYTYGGFRPILYLKPEEKWSPTYDKTARYTDINGDTAYIPEGFQVSMSPTMNTIQNGLVIQDESGNQFVWIPVQDITVMAKKTSGTDSNGRDNYAGKLYGFNRFGEFITEDFREPDTLSNTGDADGYIGYLNGISNILGNESSKYANINAFKNTMQEDYNEMIESVNKYKGFYVGRYETSLDSNKEAQSKKGEISANSNGADSRLWYGMYARQKAYKTKSVQGNMIWGSQWDSMLIWMQQNNINVVEPLIEPNTGRITGNVETDKVKNIYDLLGNSSEWTMEAYSTYLRSTRGYNVQGYAGTHLENGGITNKENVTPNNDSTEIGSRLTLYIK